MLDSLQAEIKEVKEQLSKKTHKYHKCADKLAALRAQHQPCAGARACICIATSLFILLSAPVQHQQASHTR